jgi:hypothetical protein
MKLLHVSSAPSCARLVFRQSVRETLKNSPKTSGGDDRWSIKARHDSADHWQLGTPSLRDNLIFKRVSPICIRRSVRSTGFDDGILRLAFTGYFDCIRLLLGSSVPGLLLYARLCSFERCQSSQPRFFNIWLFYTVEFSIYSSMDSLQRLPADQKLGWVHYI